MYQFILQNMEKLKLMAASPNTKFVAAGVAGSINGIDSASSMVKGSDQGNRH